MKKLFLISVISLIILQGAAQTNQKKLALVIGNAHYQNVNALKNPVNDARAIASSLRNLGFEVMENEDVTQAQMKQAINAFGVKLKDYDVGLFYYAGHGVQSKGVNYMVPIEADLKAEEEIEFDCVAADRVLAFMDAASTKINLIVLDACRNNPFARSWQRSTGGGGLAMMDAPKGSLIAYATSPGRTASDGESSNGLYTSALLKYMRNPALTIEQVFKQVRNEVSDKSGGAQIPWEVTSLTGEDFYLGKGTKAESSTVMASNEPVQNQNSLSRGHIDVKNIKVSDDDKTQAEIFYSQGKISYDALKYEKAIQDLNKALQLNPLYAEAYYVRGNAYYDLKENDKAIEDYSRSIQLNPKSSDAYYWRGNAYRLVRQDDKALSDLTNAIVLNPNYTDAYYWKARTHYDLMQDEKAIENYNKAIQLKPDYADAIFWRGQAYYDMQRYDEAISDYAKTLSLKPDDAETYYWRANAYFSLKKYQEAIQDFNKSIILKPDYADAYFYRGKVKYNLILDAEALLDFTKAAEVKPNYADAYYWQGMVNYSQKNYEKAIILFTKTIKINPRHSDAFYYRANSKYGLLKDEDAILDFDSSIVIKPSADAYYWRGLTKYNLQNYAEAIADIGKSIEMDPSGSSSYNYFYWRANAYLSLAIYPMAIKDFTKSITMKSDFSEAYFYRGKTYFFQDQREAALADINKAIELDPSNTKYTDYKATNFK
jgi:tetratricopeptide (TPR) repeat protein